MSGFRSPLDAYREDLSRARGRKRLAAGDEFWIILATGLRRLGQARARSRPAAARRLASALVAFANELGKTHPAKRGRERVAAPETGRPAEVAQALARYPDPDHACELVTHVRGAAADAEEAGAVGLAREILTDLREIASHAPALDRGLILIHLSRIERTLGDLDIARDLCIAAGDLGRSTNTRELEVRESLSLAVLARIRGNYPSARGLFESALAGSIAMGLRDVEGMAHQGLMIVSAEAGEFDAALHYGWNALSAARAEGARVAEALCNIAHLCVKAGYDAAALGGFTAALGRTTAPRVRLPALAGIAAAAGRRRDLSRVQAAERAIAVEANEAFPFETSGAWLALGRAKRALGDVVAGDAAAEKAAVIAHAHGFYEITHYATLEAQHTPAPLSNAGLEVIKSLEAWSDEPVAGIALSSAPTG